MGEDNIKLGPGTVYINGIEFVGNVTSYSFDDHMDECVEHIKENTRLVYNESGELTFKTKVNKINMFKIMGLWDWIRENCPNRRIKHLIKYGKNKRVRLKNLKRAVHLIAEMLEEKKEIDNGI